MANDSLPVYLSEQEEARSDIEAMRLALEYLEEVIARVIKKWGIKHESEFKVRQLDLANNILAAEKRRAFELNNQKNPNISTAQLSGPELDQLARHETLDQKWSHQTRAELSKLQTTKDEYNTEFTRSIITPYHTGLADLKKLTANIEQLIPVVLVQDYRSLPSIQVQSSNSFAFDGEHHALENAAQILTGKTVYRIECPLRSAQKESVIATRKFLKHLPVAEKLSFQVVQVTYENPYHDAELRKEWRGLCNTLRHDYKGIRIVEIKVTDQFWSHMNHSARCEQTIPQRCFDVYKEDDFFQNICRFWHSRMLTAIILKGEESPTPQPERDEICRHMMKMLRHFYNITTALYDDPDPNPTLQMARTRPDNLLKLHIEAESSIG